MRVQDYLPSVQLTLLFISLAIAGGLVWAAQAITAPQTASGTAVVATSTDEALARSHDNWEASLNEIQAAQGTSTMPATEDTGTIDQMLQEAKSSNMTDTIARTLLVNLSNAKSQGLGDDVPTQDQIITTAVNQAQMTQQTKTYTLDDLTIVPDSKAAKHTYGNALASTRTAHSATDLENTYIAIDNATSQNKPEMLAPLKTAEQDYRDMAKKLLAVPVPQTLAPFHLQLINNFKNIADTYPGMEQLLTDPVRGLTAIQQYKTLDDQTLQVFINIAQAFNKDGILFTKDEPGVLWSVLLSAQQQ